MNAKQQATNQQTEERKPAPNPLLIHSPLGDFLLPQAQCLVDLENGSMSAFSTTLIKNAYLESINNTENLASFQAGFEAKVKQVNDKFKLRDQTKANLELIWNSAKDFLLQHADVGSGHARNAQELQGGIAEEKFRILKDFLLDPARPDDLKQALQAITDTFSRASRKTQTLEQITPVISEILISQLFAKGRINPVQQEQSLRLGNGAIEIYFVEKTDQQPTTVRILNHLTKSVIEFCPTSFNQEEKLVYEENIKAIRGIENTSNREIKPLTSLITKEEFVSFYCTLRDITNANFKQDHVTFSRIADDSVSDPLLSQLREKFSAHFRFKDQDQLTSQERVAQLAQEHATNIADGERIAKLAHLPKAASEPRQQEDYKEQLKVVTASEELVVNKRCKIRTEFGEHYVDLTLPGRGTTLKVSFKLNHQAGGNLAELEKNLSQILQDISDKGDLSSISKSSAFQKLLSLGQITELKSGGVVVAGVDNLVMLGATFAQGAKIEGIKFTNSVLDLTGYNLEFKHCQFNNCRISMFLSNSSISECKFDKKTVLLGQLSGTLDKTEIRSNAYELDVSELKFKERDLKKIMAHLKGAIFNSATAPVEIIKVSRELTPALANKMYANLEKYFDAHLLRSLLMQGVLPSHFERIGGALNPMQLFASGEPTLGSGEINCRRLKIGKQEIIDIYPLGYDPENGADNNVDVLRIYLNAPLKPKIYPYPPKTVAFMFGKQGNLQPSFVEAQNKGIAAGEGNMLTMRRIMYFLHGKPYQEPPASSAPTLVLDADLDD